jgi:CubicO group peptidase (beta-lactamase class C family)
MAQPRTRGLAAGWCLAALALAACGTSGGAGANQNGAATKDGGGGSLVPDGGPEIPGSTTTQDLASLLEPVRAKYALPALAALVVRGSDVVGVGAVGVRELGEPTKVTTGDLFHIGGTAQTLTATIAATLVQDGRLGWNTKLGAALPGFQMHAAYTNVTLADLLAQRGGAPAVMPAAVVSAARRSGEPRALREEAARTLLSAAPEVGRGTFDESDASFLLAAVMMEHVMGTSWEALAQARVFGPLDMRTCTVVPSDLGGAPTVPWGHVVVSDIASPVWPGYVDEPPLAFAPAQGLRCSLGDWSKLIELHLAGARGATTAVLQPPSFDELQLPVDATHARGWYAVSRSWAGAGLALNYASRDPAVRALAWVLPAKNLALLVAMNQGGKAAENAADEIVGVLVGAFALPD